MTITSRTAATPAETKAAKVQRVQRVHLLIDACAAEDFTGSIEVHWIHGRPEAGKKIVPVHFGEHRT